MSPVSDLLTHGFQHRPRTGLLWCGATLGAAHQQSTWYMSQKVLQKPHWNVIWPTHSHKEKRCWTLFAHSACLWHRDQKLAAVCWWVVEVFFFFWSLLFVFIYCVHWKQHNKPFWKDMVFSAPQYTVRLIPQLNIFNYLPLLVRQNLESSFK